MSHPDPAANVEKHARPAALAPVRACVVSMPVRVLLGALVMASRVSVILLSLAALRMDDPPMTPALLLPALIVCVLLPGGLAWGLRELLGGALHVEKGTLVFSRSGLRMEFPCEAVERFVPWLVPLPGIGLSVRMHGGSAFGRGLLLRDPAALLERLLDSSCAIAAERALRDPVVTYARCRARHLPWRWSSLLLKFPLFGLVPTAPLFNVHQYIAYGGTFGQYYLQGPWPWLRTLLIYWATSTIYLAFYASAWRGVGEALAWAAAWLAPLRAAWVRRSIEIALATVYFGGVPLLLLYRFLAN